MKKLKTVLQCNWFYIILLILIFLYAIVMTKLIKYDSKYKLTDDYLEGIVIDYNIDGNKLDMIIKGKEKVKAIYYIQSEIEKDDLENENIIGINIKLIGSFNEPISNTIPNTFNYKEYLYNKRIYRIFNVETYELLGNTNIFYKIKNFVVKRINNNVELKTYLKTFILGDKRDMSIDSYSSYQKNGVSHLLAISGMHISLFSAVILFVLSKIGVGENISFFVTFSFLIFYGFLTGFPASIIRALVFMFFLNINRIFKLNISSLKCLILSVFVILIVEPFYLLDLGFQYSAITVLSLLLCSDYITGNYLVKTFKVSLIAFLFSAPLTLYNFYEINLLSPFINVLFVPFVSFVVYPIVLLSFIIGFLTPLASVFVKVLDLQNSLFGALDFGIIGIPKFNFAVLILTYLCLFAFVMTKRKSFIVIVLIVFAIYKFAPKFDNNTYLYFLDVGQGDNALIVMPYQKEVIMIDTGGEVNFNKEAWMNKKREYSKITNTLSFLKSLGIRKMKTLILTHGDYDHMGEAINLVENFKVEKVIFNCGEFNELEQKLTEVLDEKMIPYYSCIKELNIDDNKLYFLNNKDYGNENDNSSVIYTELNHYKFLFMGDAGVEVEEDLIKKYNLQDIDVLKVGHHGSKTSSSKSFIDEINPKYSIISAGKNNRYGHPNKEVLNSLNDSEIYRTDQDGSIMFKINKNGLKIEICSP